MHDCQMLGCRLSFAVLLATLLVAWAVLCFSAAAYGELLSIRVMKVGRHELGLGEKALAKSC